MKIDGRIIASSIKDSLRVKIAALKTKNIIPQLAVIFVGNDPSSAAYVRQKEKVDAEIGARVTLIRQQITNNKKQLIDVVKKLNSDPLVHGIIIQRPVPIDISKEELDRLVIPAKDVDGFHPDSPFTPPIASAVVKILEWIYKNGKKDFINWLKQRRILIIGRGETAGKPIAETLQKMRIKITIAHSKTNNLQKLCLTSDIIITCVGRANIVRHNMLKKDSILIGVGLHQENGKLKTDYDQEEIADKVAYFTPVPGGVGPVNVACLFENLVLAT